MPSCANASPVCLPIAVKVGTLAGHLIKCSVHMYICTCIRLYIRAYLHACVLHITLYTYVHVSLKATHLFVYFKAG